MTDQVPACLINEHAQLALDDWHLYAGLRGQPRSQDIWWDVDERGVAVRIYAADPGRPRLTRTSNWQGFTEVYRLGGDGRLVLLRLEYDDESPTRLVNEVITGDFYLQFGREFFGPRIYLPFRDGVLVVDRAQWLQDVQIGPSPMDTELRVGCEPGLLGP